MLGSLASFVVQEGEASEGLALIRHVTRTSTGQYLATAEAWLAAMEALAHATVGDEVQTWSALDRAEAAAERIATQDQPPWPWVFSFDARKIASHRLVSDALAGYRTSITGVTALADGADQLFARAILDHGGQIEVIVPATRYRAGLPLETHPEYDDLLSQATAVHRLEFTESSAESHMAASTLMITMISELFAVWDHQPARGYAGTADVIAHARQHGLPIRIIWPAGATRD